MNGHALSIAVDHRAGDDASAAKRLVDYLRLSRETDYFRPLARQRDDLLAVFPLLLDDQAEATLFAGAQDAHELQRRAQMLFDQMSADAAAPIFTARELAIVAAMELGQRNSEIALRLGLTQQRIRHHLNSIYRKAGADGGVGRLEVAHRVRELSPSTH